MPRTKEQTEQIRTESREKIIDTARQLFAERGFDGCTVSDIAKKAGMSQGNIYWHFASKDELFRAVLLQGFQEIGQIMEKAATSQGNSLEKFNHFLEGFLSLAKEQGGDEFITIMITFLAQGGVQRFEKFGIANEQIGLNYHQSLNAIFTQGQAEGVFNSEFEPNLMSTFFFSFINGLMFMYPKDWKDIPTEKIQDALSRLVGIRE
ncbi:MAG: hypothetical protein CL609_21570 [Anaerolineaceae bacterium]|nr:hypothetical protein [Anaerolineaceae bacterium]